MPSLPEDTYCSEQICIPPSFPYLLRQYAKAAIRTQPTDLLKWSTAYFRCLSLNVPPPVKPRLEYPIPRDYSGITPGWLKALLYQLQNSLTVPFKILWDRWIGACLQHHTLIQLLCLGGFEDAESIPFLKFIAICAGTLTDDLTHTMIMICEILTEEPEGGSAMISLETFLDLYTFLAKIDGSHGQTLRNYYFRDSLLTLWREKVEEKEEEEKEERKELEHRESSLEAPDGTKTSSGAICEGEKVDDAKRASSCSSPLGDDHYSMVYSLKEEGEIAGGGIEGSNEEGVVFDEAEKTKGEDSLQEEGTENGMAGDQKDAADKPGGGESLEEIQGEKHELKYHERHQGGEVEDEVKRGKIVVEETEQKSKEGATSPKPDDDSAEKQYRSVDIITDRRVKDREHGSEDTSLQDDLEHLRAKQRELIEETADEVERLDHRLIEEVPLTQSQEEGAKQFFRTDGGTDHIQTIEDKLKVLTVKHVNGEDTCSQRIENALEEENKMPYDDIYVEPIKGIGATVSVTLIKAVIAYMKNCAKQQQGMVMPRNIRHYNCPPLEVLDY